MKMMLHHQNTMLALRLEMGWAAFKPANDCIGFSSGGPMDFDVGTELARVAQLLGKDVIYSSWSTIKSTKPSGFTIAYREMLTVDIVDGLVPFAANDEAPIVLVSTRTDEFFAVDHRGSLVRLPGKPKNIGKGRKLALQRIKKVAAGMGDALLENNRWVAPGADQLEPEAPVETIVRFS